MDEIIGGILHHVDFLEDYFPFLFDFFRIKYGIEENVGEEIDSLGEKRVEHLGVVADKLAAGKSVQYASHGIDFPCDFQSAAPLCPFEEEVLYKMGDAVRLPPFVAGAVGDPDTYGNGIGMRYIFGNDPYAIIEDGFVDHVKTIPGNV
jgi:hypothetical protein